MQKNEIESTVKKIKRGFSLEMNGIIARSMREKGIDSYLNWGIQLPVLRRIAAEYGKDFGLAVALWKENVRECKILATLIMPPEKMDFDLVSVWMEQTKSLEIAEYAAFNVYQYVENASAYAYMWIASSEKLIQICGFNVLSGLFRRKCEPNERDINEFIDQAVSALADDSVPVKHAAMNSLQSFSLLGDFHAKIVENAFKRMA